MSETAQRAVAARVLVVEDDEGQRRTLCDILREEGFEPVECSTAADALERVGVDEIPVAVVDLRLPDLNGTQVLENIRALAGPVRVIIHTAFGSFESAKDALNLGAFAYVEKLGDPAELVGLVHRALDEVAAEAVWEIEGCLGSIVEHAPDVILQLDRAGTVTFTNRGFAGQSVDALLGNSLYDSIDPGQREAFEAAVRGVFEHGTARACEIRVTGPRGSAVGYDCRLAPVVMRDRAVRTLVVAREIADRPSDKGSGAARRSGSPSRRPAGA